MNASSSSRATVTRENYRDVSLDDWQEAFWTLYGEKDDDLKLHDMMLQLVVDSTRLTESIRKRHYDEALSCLPRVLSWLFSMNSKCAHDSNSYRDLSPSGRLLSDVIWNKYPGLCALCAETRCICPTWNTDTLNSTQRTKIYEDRVHKLNEARSSGTRPTSLDSWIGMFDTIYGIVNATRSSATAVLHYWEEVGELEVELRRADRFLHGVRAPDLMDEATVGWEAELADVFSWLSSIYLHIDGHVNNASRLIAEFNQRRVSPASLAEVARLRILPISEWLWLEYGDHDRGAGLRCHRCHNLVCSCNVGFPRR